MQTERAILFKISGGQEIGIGHIIRSLTLAREFKRAGVGKIKAFCDYSGDEKVFDSIKGDCSLRFFTGDGISTGEILKEIEQDAVKALLIDQPQESIELCRAVKDKRPDILITALDYFNYQNGYPDVVINLCNQNADAPSPEDIFPGKYYQGLEYAIIGDKFTASRGSRKDIKERTEKVLVAFGGSDIWQNTLKAIGLLTGIDYPLDIKIVIGPKFKAELIAKITGKIKGLNKHRCQLLEEIMGLKALIQWADIGFSGPGSTLMEFSFLGTPALVMPGDVKESRFVEIFRQKNAVIVLEDGPDRAKNSFLIEGALGSKEKRMELSENGMGLIDGRGKERIKDIILRELTGQ